jgi:hypothetical protein
LHPANDNAVTVRAAYGRGSFYPARRTNPVPARYDRTFHFENLQEILMAYRRAGFALTPPSIAFFLISVALALIAMLVHYAGVRVPILNASRMFDVLAIAYVVLAIGVLFRGV